MSKKYQAPRGTNDISPAPRKEPEFEIHRWHHAESTFKQIAELYQYQEIRTPMFEDIELFLRSSGEGSEVVQKEMYDFFDKGERHIALKPEGTAPVMRAYLENSMGQQGGITRLWYNTHSFRYGRPQKGRYRQLHQFGLECIGSTSPLADAEIIEITYRFYEGFGLRNLKVLLNTIGRVETRNKFGKVILEQLSGYISSQDEEEQAKIRKNPVRLLDSKSPEVKVLIKDLPSIHEFLEDDSREHFEHVKARLDQLEIPYLVTDSIVRGLDYYTNTVFEVVSESLGENLSLCGGGRYDTLVETIGGQPTPSVGVGIGVERLILTLISQGIESPTESINAYFVAMDDEAWPIIFSLSQELRSKKISCQFDIDQKKFRNQLKAADRSGAKFIIFIGADEITKNTLNIKENSTGKQTEIPVEELASWLTNH